MDKLLFYSRLSYIYNIENNLIFLTLDLFYVMFSKDYAQVFLLDLDTGLLHIKPF
jgi:hypothetical protein